MSKLFFMFFSENIEKLIFFNFSLSIAKLNHYNFREKGELMCLELLSSPQS